MRTAAVVFVVLMCSVLFAGTWTVTPIWNYGNTVYRLKVADVRGDGHARIYCGTRSGDVAELSWEHGGWTSHRIGSVPGKAYDIGIAAGRGDGVLRVYVPCEDGYLYEFSHADGSWSRTRMGGDPAADVDQVAFGDGRNDGVLRAYATLDNGHLYEFTWTDGRWVQNDMGRFGDRMVDIAVGRAADGNRSHVYASTQSGAIDELTWDNGWTSSTIGQHPPPGAPWGIELGRLTDRAERDDGAGNSNEAAAGRRRGLDLFVTDEPEHDVWCYHWTPGGWHRESMGRTGNGNPSGGDLALGRGRGDGVVRLYQSNKDAHVYEFSRSCGKWTVDDIGSVGSSGGMGVAVGPGRGDGVERVYACGPDGQVTEFTYPSADSLGAADPASLPGSHPVVFGACAVIRFSPTNAGLVRLAITDAAGRPVGEVEASGWSGVALWDGRDLSGRPVPAGVYFANAAGPAGATVTRLVRVR